MQRPWPKTPDSEAVVVRWRKSLFLLVVTGIFSVLTSAVVAVVVWARMYDKLPEEIGTVALAVLLVMLSLFGIAVIGGWITSVRNYLNPRLRFVANREGIFMNITPGRREPFFASWNEIEKIERLEVKMGVGSGAYRDEAVGIFLSRDSARNLPTVRRDVIGSGAGHIAFAQGTMDIGLSELLGRLQTMASRYKSNS